MIIRDKDNWLRLLFVRHGSVLPQILPRLLALLLLSVAVVVGHGRLFHYKIPLNASAFTLFGITLAIFLGFTTTPATTVSGKAASSGARS